MRRGLFVAVLLGVPVVAGAQGTGIVYGTVRDSAGAPLPFAIVEGGKHTVSSDSSGRYRLVLQAGLVHLTVSRIAFRKQTQDVTVAAGDSLQLDIRLGGGIPIEMQPVVTTAAKRSQLLDLAVASTAIVTDSEISRRAINTIDEAVGKAPAVQFLNGQVNIRGSTGYVQGLGSRVLLLVDGVPMNQGDRGGINWDVIPVDQVERVEIVKGAGSALYGSAALGGVINLITRELPMDFHARLRTTAGFYANPPNDVWRFRDFTGGEGGLDVAASYGSETLRGAFAAGARHSDGYRQQDRDDHWQVAGKGEWLAAPNLRVRLSGAWANDDNQTALRWCVQGACDTRGQSYQPFMTDTADLGARTTSGKGFIAGTVERTVSDQLTWTGRASWSRTHFEDLFPTSSDYAIADLFGGELRAVVTPAPDQVVTVGGEAALSSVTSDFFGVHTQGEYAAYGESERRHGVLRFTVGARADFLTVDGGGMTAVVSPRVGLVIPSGGGAWRFSAGRGFRAPSIAERFVTTVVDGLPVIPNPNLQPEVAWSFEVGHARPIGQWLHADAALFWTEAQHLIEPNVDSVQGQIQFRNLQRARWAGLDLALRARPFTERLATSAAYTFLYARELGTDSTPDRPLAFRPRHLLTLSADYALGRAAGFGADFRYSSRMERVAIYEPDPRIAAKVLDLRAEYGRGPLAAHLLVANALNYIYSVVPRTLEPVRTVTLTLVYSY
ncbi:MAG TPA: TonB-dependent receptor [Gemmatimonadales bacterium]|nr:TonB-dependent receptor [Gemmatimonadales bacterium]